MTKDVLVSIKGLQFEGALDSGQIETITRGEYYQRNGRHFVIYDEVTEGGGMPTKNIIKFGGNELNLSKRGLINTNMMFEVDKKSMTNYATPFGNILIGIDTRRIGIKEEEERIMVEAEYALEVNYEHLADCTITMDIRPADAGAFPFSS